MQPAVVAKGDHPARVDPVAADPAMGGEPLARRRCLRPSLERLGGSAPTERPVGPAGVVVAAEPVELALQMTDRGRWALPGQPTLERLVEPLDLAAGLGMARRGVP